MSNVNGKPVAREAAGSSSSSRSRELSRDFVFDMRNLSRQPGSLRDETRMVHAPDGVGSGLVLVPAGADVSLDLRFEAVSEGVLVTGSAVAPLTGECARCLDPVTSTIEVSFQELYLYQPGAAEEDDGEERYLDGDLLDLGPAFRDVVVLALPLSPLCREDCPGLCPECGAHLAEVGADHGHGETVDPRWAALRQIDVSDQELRGLYSGACRRRAGNMAPIPSKRPTGELKWLFPSGRCRAATRAPGAPSGRPPRRRW
jgi:uncharacterized protein